MKIPRILSSACVLIMLQTSLLLINGCGSNNESKNEGCPSGSNLANATDKISGPGAATFTGASSFGNPFPGGSITYAPVVFTITDQDGTPRNKVCVILYTDGFWYTDSTYATINTGSGPMNAIAAQTNEAGNVVLYWITEVLPAANPATLSSPGPPPTYTAGSDQTGQSWIKAYSGTLGAEFDVKWTVSGEPAT